MAVEAGRPEMLVNIYDPFMPASSEFASFSQYWESKANEPRGTQGDWDTFTVEHGTLFIMDELFTVASSPVDELLLTAAKINVPLGGAQYMVLVERPDRLSGANVIYTTALQISTEYDSIEVAAISEKGPAEYYESFEQ